MSCGIGVCNDGLFEKCVLNFIFVLQWSLSELPEMSVTCNGWLFLKCALKRHFVLWWSLSELPEMSVTCNRWLFLEARFCVAVIFERIARGECHVCDICSRLKGWPGECALNFICVAVVIERISFCVAVAIERIARGGRK